MFALLLLAAGLPTAPIDERREARHLADLRANEWVACINEQMRTLRKSAEPAETVATAVIALCSRFEAPVEEAWRLSLRGELDVTSDSLISNMRRRFREAVIGQIVTYRAHRP